jgi:hypothetical protein
MPSACSMRRVYPAGDLLFIALTTSADWLRLCLSGASLVPLAGVALFNRWGSYDQCEVHGDQTALWCVYVRPLIIPKSGRLRVPQIEQNF